MTEWNAGEYVERSSLQAAMAAEVLALLHLQGSEHVLDIGCGDGRITIEIAARVPKGTVLGVDQSAQMISFAASRRQVVSDSNVQFTVADARRLPFQDQFDLVVSFNALHWIPRQDLALDSIRRAMRPTGTAQLRLVPRGERKSLETVIEETRLSPRWSGYFSGFSDPYLHWSPEEYQAAAARSGLQVTRTQTADKAWDFKTREAFAAFGAVTFVEWTRRLPEDLQSAFVVDVLDRYRSVAGGRPGEENIFKFYQMDITLVRTK